MTPLTLYKFEKTTSSHILLHINAYKFATPSRPKMTRNIELCSHDNQGKLPIAEGQVIVCRACDSEKIMCSSCGTLLHFVRPETPESSAPEDPRASIGEPVLPGLFASVPTVRAYILAILVRKYDMDYEPSLEIANKWRMGTGGSFLDMSCLDLGEVFGWRLGLALAGTIEDQQKHEKKQSANLKKQRKALGEWWKPLGIQQQTIDRQQQGLELQQKTMVAQRKLATKGDSINSTIFGKCVKVRAKRQITKIPLLSVAKR